jgi:hypothetical protein
MKQTTNFSPGIYSDNFKTSKKQNLKHQIKKESCHQQLKKQARKKSIPNQKKKIVKWQNKHYLNRCLLTL